MYLVKPLNYKMIKREITGHLLTAYLCGIRQGKDPLLVKSVLNLRE